MAVEFSLIQSKDLNVLKKAKMKKTSWYLSLKLVVPDIAVIQR